MKKLFALAACCGLVSLAPAVSPRLNLTIPAGGQRGTEVSVEFRGERLDDTQEIIFYSPEIQVAKIDETKTNLVKATLKIADNCPLGEHALRLRTATGVSELRTFFVGPFPTQKEIEPNTDRAKPQKIPLNITVEGIVDREDVDYYRVTAKKGQLLSVEIEGIRLGRTMFDPYVAIMDASGKALTFSDDTSLLLQDSVASLTAPSDGDYLVEVREASYGGDGQSNYRLHVGNFSRPIAAYPAGGKAGEKLNVQFRDATGKELSQEFKLPDSPTENFAALTTRDGSVPPSPNKLRVSAFPNVLESEPNNNRPNATAVKSELPVALNGILQTNGDTDYFEFKAKKGDTFDVNVYAQRIRSPLDPVLQIFDVSGKSLGQNDDSAGVDSYLKFTAEADGDYFVQVTDQLKRGGPDFVYRVEFTTPQPSLTLSIPPVARSDTQTRQSIVVPRGNRFATLISARRNNLSGEINFQAAPLPAGVTLHADTMPADLDSFPLVFEATPDAAVAGQLVSLTGKPADSDKSIAGGFRQVVDLVLGQPNNTVYYSTTVDKLLVAVAEEAPFKISIVEPKVPLVQNGTMDLQIVAERKAGFDEPINVRMLFNPPGVGSLPDMTIPKGSNSVAYRLNGAATAQTRAWKIAMVASATVKGAPLWVSSQLAKLEVAPPFIAAKINTTVAEQGQPAKMTCTLEQKIPFEGKAIVKLLGLPAKVTAPDIEITKDDTEVVFDITVDPQSPVGQHKAVFCNIIVMKDGEPISHTVGSGGVLRIDAAKPTVAAKTGTPGKPAEKRLSRLEQLRKEQSESEKSAAKK